MPESPQSVIENTLLSLIKRFREKFTSSECFLYSENFRKQWLNIFVTLKVQQHVNGIWISITDMIPTSGQSQIIGKKKESNVSLSQCGYFIRWWNIVTSFTMVTIIIKFQLVLEQHTQIMLQWFNSLYHFFLVSISDTKKIYIYINVSISSL